MRYFLIDRITELVVGARARAVKCVTLSDETLHDHFPDFPTLPGAMILEGASQLAGFLLEMSLNQPDSPPERALLTQIELAKFHRRVQPGDCLETVATLSSQRGKMAKITVEASVEGQRVSRAMLTFMMQTVSSERLHEQRRELYRQWTSDLNLTVPIL